MKVEKSGDMETHAATAAAATRSAAPSVASRSAPASTQVEPGVDDARAHYQSRRVAHWDAVARWMEARKGFGGEYRRRVTELYRFFVPPGKRVLEIGCAHGDLLAALEPSCGVGVDFSGEMIERARRKHPSLSFIRQDAHAPKLEEALAATLGDVRETQHAAEFDVIVLSDVVNDLWDVQSVFEQLRRVSTPRTRLVLNFYSRLWEMPLAAARRLGLARPNLEQNWLTVEDIEGLLALADFEVIRRREEVLLPLPLPPLSTFANRYLVKLWPFSQLALTHFLVARPTRRAPRDAETRSATSLEAEPQTAASLDVERRVAASLDAETDAARKRGGAPLVSVVVPARNEAGNIRSIFERVPEMGAGTELVFVEGGSSDRTFEAIEEEIARRPERRCKLLRQRGKGKGDAVRAGFAEAEGDVLMILDADLTVPPEDLPRFLDVLTSGKADFANGSRLVYPMEKEAMRFFNLLANKFFSLAFSWLLGQPVKDTLCGTKVLWRKDYEALAANRAYFGDFDPFGDFDLLFGASKLNMKIVDVPVRYRDRTYGATNINRWSHGTLLLRMVLFAARRIKFI